MSLVAIGVTIGSPDTAAQVPVTSSDLAKNVAQAVTDLATLTSATSTASTDAGTADTDAGTAVSDLATALADLDAIATHATSGFIAVLGSGSGGSYAYASHQITGTADTSPSITQAQSDAIATLFNTALTAILAAQAALAQVKTDTAQVVTDAAAVSTTAVSGDLTAAQTTITDMDVLIQSDTSLCDHISLLNAALASGLNFARASDIMPA